jgi:serine/threonine-protein kinase
MAEISRPSMLALIGQVLDGRYRITSVLGEGGMGVVYRAEQIGGAPVAIKVLHDDLGDNAELRERFEREARALFALEHPNVLSVHDFGIANGSPYLVMELLEGEPLDKYLEDNAPEPPEALHIARQVLTGLAFAHAKGVAHRDLKSENVFLPRNADGTRGAKLLDFGLVKFMDDDRWGESKKLTMQGSVFGTPAYMAPEQCTGAPSDARTDVYSMGCILFELLTGLWPFMEENQVMMFRAHLMTPPPTLASVSESYEFVADLEAIIARALAKKAEDRYPDAGAMLAALNALPAVVHRAKSGVPAAPPPVMSAATAAPTTPVSAPLGPPAHAAKADNKVALIAGVIGVVVLLAVAAALVLGFLLF